MRLRNMLKICLVFWKSEPQYAYKRYAYKKTCIAFHLSSRFTRPLNGMYFPRANEDRYLIGAFGIFVMSNGILYILPLTFFPYCLAV